MGEASLTAEHETLYESLLSHSSNIHYPISNAIYTPNHPLYTSVLQAYIRNQRFNTPKSPKPILIVTALHLSHVQAAVKVARNNRVQMKIRSGGHDYEGCSYINPENKPFFILDMNNLREISMDMETETAWVQTGATLGELFYKIAETSRVHAFPAGVCPTVGVGGHLVGGGYGNLMRKYGLSVDNIVDVKLVDANGKLMDREDMGEDLFWAVRGGGASFGVVVEYKIKLVRVPEDVTVFRVERTLEQNATDIVDQWQHVSHKIDRDLFIRLILDLVKKEHSEEKTIRATFVGMFLGDSSRLMSIVNEDFPSLGLIASDCSEMSWLESIPFWDEFPLGSPTDVVLDRTPHRVVCLKRKSDYVQEPIPKDDLERIWQKMIELESAIMCFNPYGGRMSEIEPSAVPFPHRAGNLWKIQYQVNWNKEGIEATKHFLDVVRELYSFMTPFVSKNPRAAFYNYKDCDLGINHHDSVTSYMEGSAYGNKYFKDNFSRLVQIKTKFDPFNVFRHEQSIPLLPN